MSEVIVRYEQTPNPQSMKFVVNREIADETASFQNAQEAYRSPLASKVFGFPWTDAIYIGKDYITITKQDWVDWDVLADPLTGLIKEHIESGLVVLNPAAPQEESEEDSPAVKMIKKVLNEEVRPAVALDGGDIVFSKYENQVVYVFMQGSCAGCPSSTMTLKMGVEARLKEAVPEIREVVAL